MILQAGRCYLLPIVNGGDMIIIPLVYTPIMMWVRRMVYYVPDRLSGCVLG